MDTVAALVRGGVLLLATDTLPGFHCRSDISEAVIRVAEIKGRDEGKPLLVLAGSLEQAQSICGDLNPWQLEVCKACWPGPFSLILPAGHLLADRVSAGTSTVAIRVPANSELRGLILAVGVPLVSTSVNKQGEPPVVAMKDAWSGFAAMVDGAWIPSEERTEPLAGTVPSALIDLCGDRPQVLRKGPLDLPGF